MSPRKLAVGNWKMNGDLAALHQVDLLIAEQADPGCDVLICPPALLIYPLAARVEGAAISVGGQDCHAALSGAYTGDISAAQLRDAGASYVILGHSERRVGHGETDAAVAAKAGAARQAGIVAIICVGESEAQRDAGKTLEVIARQLAGSVPDGATAADTVIAYEPIWAVGTGRTPSSDQIAEVHALIRDHLGRRFADGPNMTVIYGGSVKAENAARIFAIDHVNGALVGGASLKASDFAPIVAALAAS